MLRGMLDEQRSILLGKCAGLDGDALRVAAVPPSSLTLLGLVRHMADVERWWFRHHVGGERFVARYSSDEFPDGEFDLIADAAPAADVAAFWEEVAAADATLAGHDLDADVLQRATEGLADGALGLPAHDRRYARHNGHADLLRERIDGAVGD